MEIFNEKLSNQREDIDELKTDRDDHERRITTLEISDSTVKAEMHHLIKSVNNLTAVLKWGFALAFTTLLGFFVWYIQNN